MALFVTVRASSWLVRRYCVAAGDGSPLPRSGRLLFQGPQRNRGPAAEGETFYYHPNLKCVFFSLFRITRFSSDMPGAFPGKFPCQNDRSVASHHWPYFPNCLFRNRERNLFLEIFGKTNSLKSLMASIGNDMSDFSGAVKV